jgi:beta-N-acetylhexosaminidase
MADAEIEQRSFTCAIAARQLGVNMFLAPVLDVVVGSNPWLAGRTLGRDPEDVGRIGSAYVRGVQRAGVIAVAKHFPGYSDLKGDPALIDVALDVEASDVWRRATPFTQSIQSGVKAVMMGPARVSALDNHNSASTSPHLIRALRHQFGFTGLIITDDIDAPATLRDRGLGEAAVLALSAGCDLLLLANGDHIPQLCEDITDAVSRGQLSRERLREAASRVRSLSALHHQ